MLANLDADFTTEVLRDEIHCSVEQDRRQNSYRADKKRQFTFLRYVL